MKRRASPKHQKRICGLDGALVELIRLAALLIRKLECVELKVEDIMSAIGDFAKKQNDFNDRMDKAVSGLQNDVKLLNDTIAELQSTQGAITAEDQALLDQIESRSDAIATKLEALDALTPPTPPTA